MIFGEGGNRRTSYNDFHLSPSSKGKLFQKAAICGKN